MHFLSQVSQAEARARRAGIRVQEVFTGPWGGQSGYSRGRVLVRSSESSVTLPLCFFWLWLPLCLHSLKRSSYLFVLYLML